VENTFYAALTIGLLGSAHCVGMCGGIVGALNAGLAQNRRRSALSLASHHLGYNAGRISSYAIAGAAVGLIGAQASKLHLSATISVGNLIAGLFMVALGLYLAGWWQALGSLEKAGAHIWRFIEPLGRRFLPVKTPLQAFGLGLVWGWLPCGLVYSVLTLAMVSASPLQGALTMLGFGIGTLPAMLALGNAAGHFGSLARHPVTRRVAGVGIMLFGVYSCLTAFESDSHRHATGQHEAIGSYFGEPSLINTFALSRSKSAAGLAKPAPAMGRAEFHTTNRLLADIATAANSGLRCPLTASGMATAL